MPISQTTQTTSAPQLTKGRILVIDEDTQYGRLLVRALTQEGFDATCLATLDELGGYHRLDEYDAAIVDFFQGSLNDSDIEGYVETFARHGVDVIVTSGLDIKDIRSRCDGRSWPANVHRFLCKSYGVEYTLDTLYDLTRTRKALVGAMPH